MRRLRCRAVLVPFSLACLLATACMGGEEDAREARAAVEEVGADQEPMTSFGSHPPVVVPEDPEMERADIEARIHGWTASFVGEGTIDGHYPQTAAESDELGWFVVVRKGEHVGFVLRAGEHQQKGDLYFKELMKEHHLDLFDIMGITLALEEWAVAHPSALPPQKERTGEAVEADGCEDCPGGWGPPLPPPPGDNDHRGGPPPNGGGNHPGGGGAGHGVGAPHPPGWVDPGQPHYPQ